MADDASIDKAEPSLSKGRAMQLAVLLKALASPVRLQILSVIRDAPAHESCVEDITARFAISQPAISQHLKVLLDAGVIIRDKRGSFHWYRQNATTLSMLTELVPGQSFLQCGYP